MAGFSSCAQRTRTIGCSPAVVLDRLVLVDSRMARDTSFVFAGHVTGGELMPQLGEIAEVGWLDRDEIAARSRGLDRLIGFMDSEFRYLGLP